MKWLGSLENAAEMSGASLFFGLLIQIHEVLGHAPQPASLQQPGAKCFFSGLTSLGQIRALTSDAT